MAIGPWLTAGYLRFEALYPDASAFIVAADLRHELFSLTAKTVYQQDTVTDYDRSRISEIQHAPACEEPWFTRKLEELKAVGESKSK